MENCGILFLSREDYTGLRACIDHLGNRLDAPTSGRFFYDLFEIKFCLVMSWKKLFNGNFAFGCYTTFHFNSYVGGSFFLGN